jgi:hypothetical protein
LREAPYPAQGREDNKLGLNGLDTVAASREAMCGIAFGILIGQQIAAGELSGQRALIFAGNELEILALVRQFLQNRRGNDR